MIVIHDPIFAAIDAHRRARTALDEASDSDDENEARLEVEAMLELTSIVPNTAAGLAAALSYLTAFPDEDFSDGRSCFELFARTLGTAALSSKRDVPAISAQSLYHLAATRALRFVFDCPPLRRLGAGMLRIGARLLRFVAFLMRGLASVIEAFVYFFRL